VKNSIEVRVRLIGEVVVEAVVVVVETVETVEVVVIV